MIEVEIKLPVSSCKTLESELQNRGFIKSEEILETDLYLDNAAQQIRNGGQALRIRSIENLKTGKTESVITFKGKKLDNVSMTRKELETGVQDADVCKDLLQELGFVFVPPKVVKKRVEYKNGNLTACLDEVQDLGDFLELEIVIPDDDPISGNEGIVSVPDNDPISGNNKNVSVPDDDPISGNNKNVSVPDEPFEIGMPADHTRESALARIETLLNELGYSLSDTTRHSYLSMLQAKL